MRFMVLTLCALAASCAAPNRSSVTNAQLVAADPATSLITGERIDASWTTTGAEEGMDPLVVLTLRHADGRAMAFEQGNHTNNDLMAQRPGGALAQVMGLFGEESPTLYNATTEGASGGPFFCGPDGPSNLGLFEAEDGTTQMVGLKQPIQFETRPDGVVEALPFSPDMVCARLRFRRG